MLNTAEVKNSGLWSFIQLRLETGKLRGLLWDDCMLPRLRRGDVHIQEAYVAHFWPVVEREAAYYKRAGGDVDDLKGEAALALWEAVFSYKPLRHRTEFSRYVKNFIHQRVRRAYHHQVGHNQTVEVIRFVDESHAIEDRDLSLVERILDLKAALGRLSHADQHVLQSDAYLSFSDPEYELKRKRRTRVRNRLRRMLQTDDAQEKLS